jgi:hypothetical protein
MPARACARCGGSHVIRGICPDGRRQPCYGFLPNDVKPGFWDWNPLTVRQVESGLTACLACGLVWFEVDPVVLRDLIAAKGTAEAKRALPPAPWPPHGTDPATT